MSKDGDILEETARKLVVSYNKMIYGRTRKIRDTYYLESISHLEHAEAIINQWMRAKGAVPPLKYGDVTKRKGWPPNLKPPEVP